METISLRPITEGDTSLIAALFEAAEAVDDRGEHYDDDDVREHFFNELVDLDRDTHLGERDGAVVACGIVQGQAVMRDTHNVWCWGTVHPDHRRKGIGRELLTWQLARAEELHRERHHDAPASVAIDVGEHHDGARALAEALELAPVRHWFEMERTLDGALPEIVVPDGIALEPFTWDRDDEVRRGHNRAFAKHYGSTERTPEEWQTLFTGSRAFRPDLSVVAISDDGRLAGYALSYVYPADNEATGKQQVWLGQIGTLPEARGIGAGRALLASVIESWKLGGMEIGSLGVDSENATGALGLYERAGFAVSKRSTTWAVALPALSSMSER